MKITDVTELTLGVMVNGWSRHSITRNEEYQRARAWKPDQQKLLIDSVLRGYPLPRFYFCKDEAVDPLGNPAMSFQVIDGLQRIIAFADYMADKWPLLDPAKESRRFPRSIADAPCPWAGRAFSELAPEHQERLQTLPLAVVVIDSFDTTDELRDLFIRLQAGTALTRQQIRDAWPGTMSEYISRVAGKETRRGRFEFLSYLDRRGSRRDDGDELDDPYHDGRQTAAQLLSLFLDRRRGLGVTGVDANALDDLYHRETDFEPHGPLAVAFEEVLGYAKTIVQDRAYYTSAGTRTKVSKLHLFTLFLALTELAGAMDLRLDREVDKLARAFWAGRWPDPTSGLKVGKATSAATITQHLRWFEEHVVPTAAIARLDPRRSFNDAERAELWRLASGICSACSAPLVREEADFDHITPWIEGGPTAIENGRAIHRSCNRSSKPRQAQAA